MLGEQKMQNPRPINYVKLFAIVILCCSLPLVVTLLAFYVGQIPEETFFWLGMGLITVIAMAGLAAIYQKAAQAAVKKHSKSFGGLVSLNRDTEFFPLCEDPNIFRVCNSKQSYDRCDLTQLLYDYIYANTEIVQKDIDCITANAKDYNEYCEKYQVLLDNETTMEDYEMEDLQWIPYWYFCRIEKKLKEQHKLPCPPTDIEYSVRKQYDSPAGRNHYAESAKFHRRTVSSWLQTACNKIEQEQNKERQRSLMTASLRYDVLKRDHFRCVLCGRSANDGVRLHVDHILPVAKGGKTVLWNLRTLCSECNLGKSDKYDEAGEN